jgi:hypothetical protein
MRFEPCRSRGVVRGALRIAVNHAIDFQYQSELGAIEVDDEATDRVLTPDLQVK